MPSNPIRSASRAISPLASSLVRPTCPHPCRTFISPCSSLHNARPWPGSARKSAIQVQRRRMSTSNLSRKHPVDFIPPTATDLFDLRASVQEFCKRNIPEEVAAAADGTNSFPADMWHKLGDAGLLGITASAAQGGLDMGYEAHTIVMEEISRASGSIGLSYAAHSQLCVNQVSLNGNQQQKEKYLPSLLSGRMIGALAMSETGAGSDVVSMKMKAEEVDGGYRLNGSKMWITNGPDADLIVVYAKTAPPPTQPSKGVTAFLVETKSASGFSVARKLDKLGMRGSNTGELHFEDVFVPKENVLGQLNKGVRVLMEGLDLERLVLSAGPLGLMRRALDEALPYVHTRQQFGVALAKNQLVQGKLADMYTAYRAASAFTHEVARTIDAAHNSPETNFGIESRDCTSTILFAAEQATKVCLDAVQLLGGMGYMSEVPVGRLVRDAKLYEIGAGTSEIRRVVVGRSFEKEFS
ncbi:hypothetical protein FH972_025247 [Carpinus fangiana]|uniref:Isovaleryl-CoA dehydrogenase n=1 Tax=Carpinus fangiana TaxID=176857 RepID=A0A5N6L0V7_9ROSI|nr:hypothetical protein FH972_025247 [Carpinus fangiana]